MKFTEYYKHAQEIWDNWERAECRQFDEWQKPVCRVEDYPTSWLNDPQRFRLRPEPKMVEFGPEDIKPGMMFRHKDWPTDIRRQWSQASTNVIEWYDLQQCTYEDLQKSWFWSTDGVTWNRCEKNKEDK